MIAEPQLLPADRQRGFRPWHFAMVNDRRRSRAIEQSIAALDLHGKTVFEIGSGTGLVALLFAKHGAARVISCETDPTLARVAQQITAETPYADCVTIIEGSSTEVIDRGVLPDAPDVIFTETLDCGVVGEGFGLIAADIRRICGSRTHVMPSQVRQHAALIDSVGLAELNRATTTCGFDLRLLNTYATQSYFPVHPGLHEHRLLSAPHQVRRYTYLACAAPTAVSVPVTGTGTVHGLLSWFAADFGAATVSTGPASGSHWHQAFHPLPEDVPVTAGDSVSVLIDDAGCGWVAER